MSDLIAVWGSAWNSAHVHLPSSNPLRRSPKVHSSSLICGVGPADRTGKSVVTYCPGGTRPAGPSWRLRWKPREMGLTSAGYALTGRSCGGEQVHVQRDDHGRDEAGSQHR